MPAWVASRKGGKWEGKQAAVRVWRSALRSPTLAHGANAGRRGARTKVRAIGMLTDAQRGWNECGHEGAQLFEAEREEL